MTNRIKVINFNDSLTTSEQPSLSSVQGSAATADNEFPTYLQAKNYADGVAGGAGSEYANAYYGEDVSGSSVAKAVTLNQRKVLAITASTSYLDINEGGGEVSVQCVTTSKDFQIADLDHEGATEDLCDVIQDALNGAGGLSFTYSCTYSSSTRKITISASSAFSILWKTGTHGSDASDDNIGANGLSFDTSADDTGLTNYTADNTIENAGASIYVDRAYVYKYDADYLIGGRNFDGFVTENGTKGNTATVKSFQELQNLSSLNPGSKYYGLGARIVIDDNNKYIDFNDPTVERNATIATGTYYRGSQNDGKDGYPELATAIKTAMEAVSTYTFTVSFDKYSTNKWTVATGSGNFALLNGTGTNAGSLFFVNDGGFAASDTSSAASHTSTSAVDLAGNIGLADNSLIAANSQYVGKAIKSDGTTLFTEKNWTMSEYSPVYQSPNDWLASPFEKDPGTNTQLISQHENADGKGIRMYVNITDPQIYKFQYKTGTNADWQDSTTTIVLHVAGASGVYLPDEFGGSYHVKSKVFMDENGVAVAAVNRYDSAAGKWEGWAYYSTDGGDNWTAGDGGTALFSHASVSVYCRGLAVRENKALIVGVRNDNAACYWNYSDYSAGYGTWSKLTDTTIPFEPDMPVEAYIQYFAGETGVNKYRLCCLGYENPATDIRCRYYKGDLTSAGVVNIWSTLDNVPMRCCGQDQTGLKNRIVVTRSNQNQTTMEEAESNEDYNGGVMTFNNHSNQNIFGGSYDFEGNNGYNSTDAGNLRYVWNEERRCLVVGNFCYIVDQVDVSGASRVHLAYTKNLTGGTWETPVVIGNSTLDDVECWIQYIPSRHGFMVGMKRVNGKANNLTAGRIYAQFFEILGDGSFSQHDVEQIDGGEADGGFQGTYLGTTSVDGITASWDYYNGSRDILWSNIFK